MKITSVYIEQFGQFQNQRFQFPEEPLIMIQGQNEAGKTTLIHFIKYMLFGFPSRTQLNALGFSVDQDAKLGGRLIVTLSKDESVSIVRHLRKEKGEAKLYFSNGDVQDESRLQEWLKGMDLSLYNAIFSLDLDGLQNLHRLKPETLQHYLFSTGMTGNSKVLDLERKLEKEVNERFKPNGKNPPINQTLIQLDQTRNKLRIWEQKLTEYEDLKAQQTGLEKKLSQLDEKRTRLLEHKQAFLDYRSIEPSLIKYHALKKELEGFPENLDSFPKEGRERYETWRTQVVTLESEKADYLQQLEELEREKQHLEEQFDERWLIKREAIRHQAVNHASLEGDAVERIKLEAKRNYEEEEVRRMCSQIGVPWTIERASVLLAIDTGLALKQRVKSSLQELDQLDQESVFIHREIAKLNQDKEDAQQLHRKMDLGMTDEALKEAEAIQPLYERSGVRKEELKWLKQDIQRAVQRNAGIDKMLTFTLILPLLGLVIGGLFALFSHIGRGLIPVIIGIAWVILFTGLMIGLRQFLQKFQTPSIELKEWKRRLKELEEEEQLVQTRLPLLLKYEHFQKAYQSRLEYVDHEQILNKKLEDRQAELEETESLKEEREETLRMFLKEKGYVELQDISIALEMIQLVEKAKEKVSLILELESDIQKRVEQVEKSQAHFQSLQDQLGQSGVSIQDLLTKLEQMEQIEEARTKNKHAQTLLKKQCASLEERIARFNKECYNLWQQASVTSEEDYYEKAALYRRKQERQIAYEDVALALQSLLPERESLESMSQAFCDGIWKNVTRDAIEEGILSLEAEYAAVLKEMEDHRVSLRHIEEDEQYPDLIHHKERLKDKLNQEAHNWSVYKIALGILSQAKKAYKENRLPKLLNSAESYFERLTNHAYSRLYYEESNGFTVEHSSGAVFKAEELSRGTAEQLYVSIRLGLVQLFDGSFPLPLLVDDGFVNFDERRTESMLNLLQELSFDRQVILLTCRTDYDATLNMEEWKKAGRKVVFET